MSTIEVIEDQNANVLPVNVTRGTTEPVFLRADKVDPGEPSVVELRIADRARNVTECDPIITTLTAEVPEHLLLE